MTTVRAIVSEAKYADGLTKFTGPVLDIGSSTLNVPEWIRRVRTWLELYAIDGTASALSVTPFVEPAACFPKENGPNSWIPTDPDTGAAAVLDEKTLEKLKGAKFVAHAAIQVNLANQVRVIFQVILNSAISKQSQTAVKNSAEWDALATDLNGWAELLNLIVRLHTIQRGAMVGEAAIVAKFAFDSKIRGFKQNSSTDSGAHLERFDDLVAEGKAIGANLDQRELAYLVVNSMKSNAARNKRSLLMDIGQNTPQSYAVAKAFVLEAEAMARSVAEFNAGHSNRGYAALTEHREDDGKSATGVSEVDVEESVNLVTAQAKSARRVYTAQQKKSWKMLDAEAKKKVTELEQLADKIRGGEPIDVDLRTITSTLTSSVIPRSEPKKCWKCMGDHVMSECPQKETIKGTPHAPVRRSTWRPKSYGSQKKGEAVALVQESTKEEDSDEDYFHHLDNLVTFRGCWPSKTPKVDPEASLFLDEDGESECDEPLSPPHREICLITGELEEGELELNEPQVLELHTLKGLDTVVRKPTSEEVAFQADLIAMPHLCRAELQRNRWQTVSVNGVTVVKGGCFDTISSRAVWMRWGFEKVPDEAQRKPGGGRPRLAPSKTEILSDEEGLSAQGKIDFAKKKFPSEDGSTSALARQWLEANGQAAFSRNSEGEAEEAPEKEDFEQLADLKQEYDELEWQLSDTQNDLKDVRSQLAITSTEARRSKMEYERALGVVREVAQRELDEVKNEATKEMCRMQSELDKTKAELKGKEKVVSQVEADAISGSLSRSLQRNAYLVSCLDKADAENVQEKQQVEFFQRALEQERAEVKTLTEQLAKHRKREEERVSAYRRALSDERQTGASLRQTLKELKESSARTEEKLNDSEHTNKEAMEELDRYRAMCFPHDQGTRGDSSSEARSQGSSGRYSALAPTWEEERESTDARESDNNKKRSSGGVSEERPTPTQTKKAKTSKKETPPKNSPRTPDKGAPEFDPSNMEQITPIFGQSGSSRGLVTEVIKESDKEKRREEIFDELSRQTADSDKKKRKERRLKNELARLAPQNGIDLVGYTSRRTERRDADEAAALEREKVKARRSILWNCSQSLEVRANLRVTEFSIREVEAREKTYRDVLMKSKEDGPGKFMDLLNDECRYSTHPQLTSQWLEEEVLRWISNPKDRQKPIKLPMPPRDPVFYQRIVDERERRASERKLQANQSSSSHEGTERKEGSVPGEVSNVEEDEDTMPSLVEDSDSDDDEGPSSRYAEKVVDEEEEESVNARIAEESLATIEHSSQSHREEEELTIHDLDVVTLDNAASTHIFRNDKLLHSLRQVKDGGVSIGGLKAGGEGVICEKKGMFLSVTGVLFGKESIANLLSQATLVDQGHRVEYDTPTDVFTVEFRGTGVSLQFRRQKRAESETKTKHYVCKINQATHAEETVLIETIKERQGRYTKAEVAEAAKAREQSAMLNFPSLAAHLDMIAQGSIQGNQVTREALMRSVDIWGRATERSKGNSVHTKPTAAARRIDDIPEQATRHNSAHADLLFVKGIIFLIVILDPMKYVWVYRLISRTTEEIRKGIDKFFADMRSYRVNITCLRCDGEGGIWALESEIKMRGTRMDKAAAGKHVEFYQRERQGKSKKG